MSKNSRRPIRDSQANGIGVLNRGSLGWVKADIDGEPRHQRIMLGVAPL
jgi:hypothetical protein